MAQSSTFTFNDTLTPYSLPLKQWHALHHNKYTGLIAAALIFEDQSQGHESDTENGVSRRDRVLLLRRAAHDFVPDKWEPPGGSVDDEHDESMLHACARELKEEANLTARYVQCTVGRGVDILDNKGKMFLRVTFLVEDGEKERREVMTDPGEHSEWRWVTEEEVEEERMEDGREMPITFPSVKESLLEGFRLRKMGLVADGQAEGATGT